jgi:[ribosomal protein S18]-alanine N-acetyltransferase
MSLTFTLMNEAEAREIRGWQYAEPYAIYNMLAEDEDGLAEMLDRRSPYYTVRDEQGVLVGFFCFGTAAQALDYDEPGLYSEGQTINLGLGMRPDLTGQGLGLAFVQLGLDFARENFAPRSFRLFVLAFNKRATRVYERAGFVHERIFLRRNQHSEITFLEMRRPA